MVVGQQLSHGDLGEAVVIGVGGVVVVDAVLVGVEEHFLHFVVIHLGLIVVDDGQAHHSEAQLGNGLTMKFTVNQVESLLLF